jgi:hypothetical protein
VCELSAESSSTASLTFFNTVSTAGGQPSPMALRVQFEHYHAAQLRPLAPLPKKAHVIGSQRSRTTAAVPAVFTNPLGSGRRCIDGLALDACLHRLTAVTTALLRVSASAADDNSALQLEDQCSGGSDSAKKRRRDGVAGSASGNARLVAGGSVQRTRRDDGDCDVSAADVASATFRLALAGEMVARYGPRMSELIAQVLSCCRLHLPSAAVVMSYEVQLLENDVSSSQAVDVLEYYRDARCRAPLTAEHTVRQPTPALPRCTTPATCVCSA